MFNAKIKSLKIFLALLAFIAICHLPSAICHLYAQDYKEEESLFVAKKAFEDGFYEVSLGLLERFLKNYPNSSKIAEVHLLIGQCYFHQNRFLDALAKFQELLKLPSARDIKDAVLYWMGEVHFRGNAFSQAAQFYKMLIDEFPKSSYLAASFYSLGWCLFQGSDFSQAIEYFKIVEERFPKEPQRPDASFKIIECLYSLKDYAGLISRIKFYLKTYPKEKIYLPYLYFYFAEADYYLNDFNDAIEEYLKVLANTTDDKIRALSYLGMGWSYLKLKKYKEAEGAFLEIKADSLEKRSLDILLLGKAILWFEMGELSQAKNAYNELLNTKPEVTILMQAYLGKAEALYGLAEYKAAIDVYKEALDKISLESVSGEFIDKLHYGLSWAYLKEGEFRAAIETFQKLIKQTEDKVIKVSALCQVGDTFQESGDYNQAIQIYDSILKDYPDSFYSDYVQYQLGISLLKLANFEGAIMAFNTLVKNFSNSKLLDDAYYALGLAYFQKEDYGESLDIFEKFQLEFKESALRQDAMYLQGTSLYNLGKFDQAIEVFKNIIRAYSQNIELVQKAEYEIADCYYQLGDEKEAMGRFKILRSKYPDSKLTPEVIWWLGEYYYRHNDLKMARRYFSSLVQDFPKSNLVASSYYALGSTYDEESRYPEAIDNFKKVIELDTSDLAGTAGIAIADIYTRINNLDSAISAYKEVVLKYPHLNHLIYPKLAGLYSKAADFKQALELYHKSLEVVPVKEMVNIQFKIGQTQEALGEFDEAVQEYLKVTYLYSENQDLTVKAFLRVAAIYEDKEKFIEAVNIYKRIISMNVEEAKYAKERMDRLLTLMKEGGRWN